ncbi:MAG TPA: hypothetical protein VJ885_10440 [Thermoanaerobaculia bacterium]|nr:hypothetical protein [Thermoanaerobaculia bacterium]
MANERPKDTTVSLGDNISLDQLISATSTSVLRALKEHESQGSNRLEINPRIWVGIWIDLERLRLPGGFNQPGGPGGGGIGG